MILTQAKKYYKRWYQPKVLAKDDGWTSSVGFHYDQPEGGIVIQIDMEDEDRKFHFKLTMPISEAERMVKRLTDHIASGKHYLETGEFIITGAI